MRTIAGSRPSSTPLKKTSTRKLKAGVIAQNSHGSALAAEDAPSCPSSSSLASLPVDRVLIAWRRGLIRQRAAPDNNDNTRSRGKECEKVCAGTRFCLCGRLGRRRRCRERVQSRPRNTCMSGADAYCAPLAGAQGLVNLPVLVIVEAQSHVAHCGQFPEIHI